MAAKKVVVRSLGASEERAMPHMDPQMAAAFMALDAIAGGLVERYAQAKDSVGPVNLQALWCDIVKGMMDEVGVPFCGGPGTEAQVQQRVEAQRQRAADDASSVADLVVAAFVSRAEDLAAKTAQLAYYDPADTDDEADGATA